MNPRKMMTFRVGLGLLMAGTALGAQAEAQSLAARPQQEGASAALTRHLRTIADQPRNVAALIGAGKAALELGDAQAALTFFARAEEISPRDGRSKAGMGAAFVQLEQVHAALQFFSDAASLGVPEAEFAGDRGLAYDLSGDPRRAQADYNLALRRQENAEVRRRLALSLAISGEQAKALAAIDGQLRAHDRAAWRVRSFILALTGDAAEATRSAQAVMPAQAAQMRPFFAALPGLSPAERAMAVHFGHFPNDGRPLQVASANPQYASAAPSVSAAPGPVQPTPSGRATRTAEAPSSAPRRRPGSDAAGSRRTRPMSILEERSGWTNRSVREKKPAPTVLAEARSPSRAVSPTNQPKPLTQAPAVRVPVPQATVQPPVQQPPVQQAPVQQAPVQQPVVTAQRQASAVQSQAPVVASQTPATASVPGLGTASSAAPATALTTAQPATGQAPQQAATRVQLGDVAPSQPQSPLGNLSINPPAATTPAAAPQPAERGSGLAGIIATIESLPTESVPPIAAATPSAGTQLALNTSAKPAYGPKIEVPKAQPAKAASAEKKKDEPSKDAAAKASAKKEDAKAAAAKKEADSKVVLAKKEADAKTALAKKQADAKSAAAKKELAAKATETKKEAPKKEPSRHWVQIAGGANEAAMTREFLRLKAKAPKLLAARAAWTTPLRATNRLLVGPFKSADEAQDFVNELSKLSLPAFSWTSPAGQEIVKLASK